MAEKVQLCKCNNCDTIMFDENPQVINTKFEIPLNTEHMIQIEEDESFYWACPKCKTDAHLIDITSESQL
jgi:hypothetical protein